MIQKRSALTQRQLQRLAQPYYKYGITKQANIFSSFMDLLRNRPQKARKSFLGKLIFHGAQAIPHTFNTDQYDPKLARETDGPIRIVFSGMGDSRFINYAPNRFKAYYGQDAPVYTFGWSQLPEALSFIKKVGKDKPCIVYGFSWGSQAAQQFVNKSGANVIKAHFLDPMRKDVRRHHVLKQKRLIPATYTTAIPYDQNDFRHDAFNVLRYKHPDTMIQLGPVSSHGAIQQWLPLLDQQQRMQADAIPKAASYKYGHTLTYI